MLKKFAFLVTFATLQQQSLYGMEPISKEQICAIPLEDLPTCDLVRLWRGVALSEENPTEKKRLFDIFLDKWKEKYFYISKYESDYFPVSEAVQGPFCQLKVTDSLTPDEIVSFKTSKVLSWLDLWRIHLDDTGAQALGDVLKENTSLISLYLGDNRIGKLGIQALSDALLLNTSLTKLDLSGNNLQEEVVPFFSQMFQTNRTLRVLNLSNNNFKKEGLCKLVEALQTNETLESIDLSANYLEHQSDVLLGDAFAVLIELNRSLKTLKISTNNIGREGTQAIAEILKTNTTLTKLDLASICCDGEGIAFLCAALEENKGLKKLNLSRNRIRKLRGPAIANLLTKNSTLLKLDLQGNLLFIQGVKPIISAWKQNTSLESLSLLDNQLTESEILDIKTELWGIVDSRKLLLCRKNYI